jgi:hypothetical protein
MIPRIVVALSAVVLLAVMCASSLPAAAQAPTVPDAAVDLVRITVAKEVAAANDSSAKYMFRASKKTRGDDHGLQRQATHSRTDAG